MRHLSLLILRRLRVKLTLSQLKLQLEFQLNILLSKTPMKTRLLGKSLPRFLVVSHSFTPGRQVRSYPPFLYKEQQL